MDNILVNVISLILLIVGIWFFSTGFMFTICGLISAKWPTIQAFITESKLKEGTTRLGTKAYWPIIKYEYSFKNLKFIGKRIAFGKYVTKWNNTHNKKIAQRIINRYKVGHPVLVHYLPIFKRISVLEPGFSWGSIGILCFGVLWLCGSIVFLIKLNFGS